MTHDVVASIETFAELKFSAYTLQDPLILVDAALMDQKPGPRAEFVSEK